MPISMAEVFNLDAYLENMSNIDANDLYYSTESLLSDDIWKKFELDFADLTGFDIINELDYAKSDFAQLEFGEICEIRNHDCMWAGHCGSKEHPSDEPKLFLPNNQNNTSTPGAATSKTPALKTQQQPVSAGRSLLNKNTIKNNLMQVVQSPESPPMSDDEETKTKQTTTLQLLKDAISECDLDEDSDLCEYFEDDCCDDDDDDDVDSNNDRRMAELQRSLLARESDHCYHKDKNASMRTRNLGIETPSDSEEEIDVVSVCEKLTNRMVTTLPTNPSNQDRQKLQKTVATAINNKHINNNGIKTLLPSKKPIVDHIPIKRRVTTETRGIKRTKHQQHRITPENSPYKRRVVYGHSSDSEPEPSEKRSLHNNMERQRRIDLRNAFEDLRMLIPVVSQKERAAKVVILREAAKYCDDLGSISVNKSKEVEDLRRQQERLRARVSQLRRSLAAKR